MRGWNGTQTSLWFPYCWFGKLGDKRKDGIEAFFFLLYEGVRITNCKRKIVQYSFSDLLLNYTQWGEKEVVFFLSTSQPSPEAS